jgi:hypothetical protein
LLVVRGCCPCGCGRARLHPVSAAAAWVTGPAEVPKFNLSAIGRLLLLPGQLPPNGCRYIAGVTRWCRRQRSCRCHLQFIPGPGSLEQRVGWPPAYRRLCCAWPGEVYQATSLLLLRFVPKEERLEAIAEQAAAALEAHMKKCKEIG